MEQPALQNLADFIAVAVHGGLNAASRAVGVPKATLSRRVRELEAALGARLLERGRQLRLTEEGRFLLEKAAPHVSALWEIGEAVRGQGSRPTGPLRISAPSLFARTRLGRLGAEFVARYPEVSLEIDVDDSIVDPVRDGYDVVVRVNPAPDSELVGQCFLRTETVLAAPPGLELPASGGDVAAVVLAAQSGLTEWWAVGPDGEIRLRPRPLIRSSSMMLVHEAALGGAGAALLPRWLIEEDLAAGRLVLWGEVPNRRIEAWALHTSRRLASPKVRLFVESLVAAHRPD